VDYTDEPIVQTLDDAFAGLSAIGQSQLLRWWSWITPYKFGHLRADKV
jgi:hypothetical protein